MILNLTDTLYALSDALDTVQKEMGGISNEHGKNVAFLSYLIGNKLNYNNDLLNDLVGLAILHDNAFTEYVREEYNNGELLYYDELKKESVSSKVRKGFLTAPRHNVIGEENPVVFDLSVFASNMLRQIEQGMMESLEYKDGLLIAVTREGNILKKCIYDFGFRELKKVSHDSANEQIEKRFVLDIDKFRGHGDTLCFNVLGEENPTVYDLSVFVNQLVSLIEQGFVETLDFKDDFLFVTINDGHTMKKYTYDFGFGRLENVTFGMGSNGSFDELKNLLLKVISYYKENPNKALEELKGIIFKIISYYNENPDHSLEELKSVMFKVVSYYNENPNREIMSKQKYIRMILDIMDGDRLPNMESKEEILRVFQVYHGNKGDILQILLDNVVFYDDNGNVLDYSSFIRTRKLEAIKYDILNQMEIKMLMFAVTNNAYDLYQEYNNRTHIPRVEVEYKYVDQEGNEIEAPVEEVEAGNLLTFGKEIIKRGAKNIRDLTFNGIQKASKETALVLEKIKERKRTR